MSGKIAVWRRTLALPVVALLTWAAWSAMSYSSAMTLSVFSGTATVEDPGSYSRVLAVSDVHGMLPALLTLLRDNLLIDTRGHWSGGKALLVVTGDSIDKGPQSIGIIDLWIKLMAEAEVAGGRVLHLLGNHEAEFLANPTASNAKAAELLAELQAQGIPIEQLTNPAYPRGKFLHSLPVAARIGKWLFCHAGYYPAMSWKDFSARATDILSHGDYGNPFLADPDSILEAKQWWISGSPNRSDLLDRLKANGFEGVVFGHQPKALNVKGRSAMSDDGKLIKIDNGMAPEAGAHPGSLLVFEDPRELSGATRPHVSALVHGLPEAIAGESLQALGLDFQ